jgi:hypothetical protein
MHLVSLCSLDSVSPSASFASHGNASWEVTEKEATLIRYHSLRLPVPSRFHADCFFESRQIRRFPGDEAREEKKT